MSISGSGAVLPAGSVPATSTLPEGGYRVTIDGIDDSGLFRCVYPGGFVKHHQAATVEALAVQVANQLKARYGANEVKFYSVPKKLAAGEAFTVEA